MYERSQIFKQLMEEFKNAEPKSQPTWRNGHWESPHLVRHYKPDVSDISSFCEIEISPRNVYRDKLNFTIE